MPFIFPGEYIRERERIMHAAAAVYYKCEREKYILRSDAATYTRVETIAALGGRISRAAGLSSNLELVVRQTKLGGNGPIMANAMIESGCAVTYVGCLGRPALHPVFAEMARRCKACYSLAEPGTTDALEFRDGKLMLGKHETLKEVTWERMIEVAGKERSFTITPFPRMPRAC